MARGSLLEKFAACDSCKLGWNNFWRSMNVFYCLKMFILSWQGFFNHLVNKPQTIWASTQIMRIKDNLNIKKHKSGSLSRLKWRNIKNRNAPSKRISTHCGLPSACHQPLELVFYRATKTTLLHKYTTVTCLPIVLYSRETKYSHDTVVM